MQGKRTVLWVIVPSGRPLQDGYSALQMGQKWVRLANPSAMP